MQSLECQVQEDDCGDYIPLAGAKATTRVLPDHNSGSGNPVFSPNGDYLVDGEYVDHGPSSEAPHGEWNQIEVFAMSDQLVFVVNGTPNMALSKATRVISASRTPLVRGKLQIQSEGAEIQYRRIKIRSIQEFPSEIAKLFD